jgi:hypothetical protein
MNHNNPLLLLAITCLAGVSFSAAAQNIIRINAPLKGVKAQDENPTENWIAVEPFYAEWINVGSPSGCTNWSPSPDTVGKGISFEQTATDCEQGQSRAVQQREMLVSTGEYRNVGGVTEESRNVSVSQAREAVGTLENWVAASPNYTNWQNTGGIYQCTNWTPDPSTIDYEASFTQTANDCKQDQTRSRQEREQETNTLAYRNVGTPITETQTLNGQTTSRTAIGTKVDKVCLYDESDDPNKYMWLVDDSSIIMTTDYRNVPGMWQEVPGTSLNYNDGTRTWTISRGALVKVEDDRSFYQVCYE